MLKRISKVEKIDIQALSFSSHLLIGDSTIINAKSDTFAVKRDKELFFGNEGDDANYDVFTMPLELPPIDEQIYYRNQHLCGSILVNQINILGVTSSSIIQIGSNEHMHLEDRRKEIRQIAEPENIEKATNQTK
ncbi:spore germination protein GerPE [Caldifermentibacillus hisashii]|uniref:spore germination protein GerPE n=1 Tax=Caldifermentibacillus hisashii TaxID=996558 RepID=UPI0034D3C156